MDSFYLSGEKLPDDAYLSGYQPGPDRQLAVVHLVNNEGNFNLVDNIGIDFQGQPAQINAYTSIPSYKVHDFMCLADLVQQREFTQLMHPLILGQVEKQFSDNLGDSHGYPYGE